MFKNNQMHVIPAIAILALSITTAALAGESMMMAPQDKSMQMDKMDKMDKEAMMAPAVIGKQQAYSDAAFAAATASGETFIVAFHKKGCALCQAQQKALNEVYTREDFKNLTVLVVEYPTDKATIGKFAAKEQGTLITFKGGAEINRSQKLTQADDISQQLKG